MHRTVFILAVLILAGSVAAQTSGPGALSVVAQSSHARKVGAAKAPQKTLSPKFKDLAEDALDAVDRAWLDADKADVFFQPLKLEAERLEQKMERAASTESEKKVSVSIGGYFGSVLICRLWREAVSTAATQPEYQKNCSANLDGARDEALRSLGRKVPPPRQSQPQP